MSPLEERLRADLLEVSEQATKLHYYPARFVQMIHEDGPVLTARSLLTDTDIQSGLIRLWDLKRLELSLEAQILKPEYAELFTTEELRSARARLTKLDWQPATV